MSWVLVGAGWFTLALLLAVLIGRSVRIADARAAADAAAEANFVVEPATEPRGFTAAPAFPYVASSPDDAQTPAPPSASRDAPTIPGIPAARPRAPGAGNADGQIDPIRKAGSA